MANRNKQTLDGLPVFNADETLMIDIVKEDVRAKFRKDPGQCAVAQACKRICHTTEARAYRSRVYVLIDQGTDNAHWLRFALSEATRQEVAAYDRGGGFSTGSYRLTPLPEKQPRPKQDWTQVRRGTGSPKLQNERGYRVQTGVREPSPLAGGAIEATLPYRQRKGVGE
jgi:hypothetical protein